MSRVSTKDRILDAALTLFSEKGYDGASVDQIAELVGIKGPSLYRHFKGKEDILDTLIATVNEHYIENFGDVENITVIPANTQELIQSSLGRITFTIHDERIKKVRKLLNIEQFRNEKLAKLTTLHFATGLETMYAFILGKMMENGSIRQEDPELLAFEFVAPISSIIHTIDREPEYEEEGMKKMMKHFNHFAELYGVEK